MYDQEVGVHKNPKTPVKRMGGVGRGVAVGAGLCALGNSGGDGTLDLTAIGLCLARPGVWAEISMDSSSRHPVPLVAGKACVAADKIVRGLVSQRLTDWCCVCLCVLQDVTSVVDTCHEAGISKKAVKLRPIAVIKG